MLDVIMPLPLILPPRGLRIGNAKGAFGIRCCMFFGWPLILPHFVLPTLHCWPCLKSLVTTKRTLYVRQGINAQLPKEPAHGAREARWVERRMRYCGQPDFYTG